MAAIFASSIRLNRSGLPNATDITLSGSNPGFKVGDKITWTPAQNDYINKPFSGKILFRTFDQGPTMEAPLGSFRISVSNERPGMWADNSGYGGRIKIYSLLGAVEDTGQSTGLSKNAKIVIVLALLIGGYFALKHFKVIK